MMSWITANGYNTPEYKDANGIWDFEKLIPLY